MANQAKGTSNGAAGRKGLDSPQETGAYVRGNDDKPIEPAPETDAREQRLFSALNEENSDVVSRLNLSQALREVGLSPDDRRLAESMRTLHAEERANSVEVPSSIPHGLTQEAFCRAIRPNILLIERALQGNMVIPDFSEFCGELDEIYHATKENRQGQAADYIPQLDFNNKPDLLDQYGMAVCTIDGQRHEIGDAKAFFSVQSTCKPLNYCMALEEHGTDMVHRHVGREPSGVSFNALTLNNDGLPHNPMINAGAIMCCSLIQQSKRFKRPSLPASAHEEHHIAETPTASTAADRGWTGERFDFVANTWRQLCGGERPRFNNAVFLSERETADRNFALAYLMRGASAFPEDVDIQNTLEFYFQCCSIELNAHMMSVVAATLANGGICPVNGKRVFMPRTVQNCLSLMYSCGMYDYSGEFAFTVGLPAKSGVSGCLMVVVPNVMGLCIWSPRLDRNGNSVRGVEFCKEMVRRFNFHNYDNLTGVSDKRDPRFSAIQAKAEKVNELIWAASKGDLGAIQRQMILGADLNAADYDQRTALHLAAAEGQYAVVEYFIKQHQLARTNIDLSPVDRWGGTPLNDAIRHGHGNIREILEDAGAIRGDSSLPLTLLDIPYAGAIGQVLPGKIVELIWAAAEGDMRAIRRLTAQGIPFDVADYDLRTPLHLAAAEGQMDVLRYFTARTVDVGARDRWGRTAIDEAEVAGHKEALELLKEAQMEREKSGKEH